MGLFYIKAVIFIPLEHCRVHCTAQRQWGLRSSEI